jgi:hypothetical protein
MKKEKAVKKLSLKKEVLKSLNNPQFSAGYSFTCTGQTGFTCTTANCPE